MMTNQTTIELKHIEPAEGATTADIEKALQREADQAMRRGLIRQVRERDNDPTFSAYMTRHRVV